MTISEDARPVDRAVARQDGLRFDAFGNPAIPHRDDTGAGTLRIVSSWPSSERVDQDPPAAFVYDDLSVAIQLALDLAGSAAGGFALEYVALDNSTAAYPNVWDATTEIANAQAAVDDPATVAFFGGVHTGALQQSVPILSRAEPPMAVVTVATWPGLTRRIEGITEFGEPGRYAPTGARNLVRFGLTDDGIGAHAAGWAFDTAGRRSAAVFHDGNRYGRCVALSFATAFAALGGVVSETTALPADPIDFSGHVASVAASGADCVVVGGVSTPKLRQFIDELGRLPGADARTIIGGDGLLAGGPSGGLAPALPEGLVAVGPVPPADLTGDGAIWTAVMRDRIGQGRDPEPFAIHVFEAAIAIIQAIDAVGSGDRTAIRAAIQATRDFRGLSGMVAIGETGDRVVVPYRVAQVQDGRFVPVMTAPPRSSSSVRIRRESSFSPWPVASSIECPPRLR